MQPRAALKTWSCSPLWLGRTAGQPSIRENTHTGVRGGPLQLLSLPVAVLGVPVPPSSVSRRVGPQGHRLALLPVQPVTGTQSQPGPPGPTADPPCSCPCRHSYSYTQSHLEGPTDPLAPRALHRLIQADLGQTLAALHRSTQHPTETGTPRLWLYSHQPGQSQARTQQRAGQTALIGRPVWPGKHSDQPAAYR